MPELGNTEESLCIECNSPISHKYCRNCGQKVKVSRLQIRSLISDLITAIIGFDGKFMRTFKDLIVKPDIVSNSFINGNRVRYMSPIAYFFISYAIVLIMQWVLDTTISEAIDLSLGRNETKSMNSLNQNTQNAHLFLDKFKEVFHTYEQYFVLVFILIIGLVSKLFYRKSGYNYIEHVVIICFTQAQIVYLNTLLLIIYALSGYYPYHIGLLIAIVYSIMVFLKVYGYKNLWLGIIKSILFLLSVYISLMITVVFVTFMSGIYQGFLNSLT